MRVSCSLAAFAAEDHDIHRRFVEELGTSSVELCGVTSAALWQLLHKQILLPSSKMNAHERIEAACSFLLQSPPGEINDVLNGLSVHRSILAGPSSMISTACGHR